MNQDGYLLARWMDLFTHFRQPEYSRNSQEEILKTLLLKLVLFLIVLDLLSTVQDRDERKS